MEPWSHSFVCQAELLRGGWSLGLINALLGGVDKQAMNPCCRSWAPMRLWLRARVAEAERSDAWSAHCFRGGERRQQIRENVKRRDHENDEYARDAYARAKSGS